MVKWGPDWLNPWTDLSFEGLEDLGYGENEEHLSQSRVDSKFLQWFHQPSAKTWGFTIRNQAQANFGILQNSIKRDCFQP